MNNVETIKPFKNFCMTIGALPSSYLESMSYYETLCWLCKYLENTINPAINNNAEALKELQEYVAHYCDNLDVTQEIDDKLDAMAESGALAEIINEQLFNQLDDKIDGVDDKVDNLANQFNLSSYVSYSPSEGNMTVGGGTYSEGSITIAKNSDGSIAKIYGTVIVAEVPASGVISLTLVNTGLTPDTTFAINPTGYTLHYISAGTNFAVNNYCYVNSNGSVTIYSQPNQIGEEANARITLYPCIYFIKDFGDIGD